MKCPYKNFEECLLNKCPSCNYEEITTKTLKGRKPTYMSTENAIESGRIWEEAKTSYKFLSCNLLNNNVQPVLRDNTVINNTTNTKANVVIHRSIF